MDLIETQLDDRDCRLFFLFFFFFFFFSGSNPYAALSQATTQREQPAPKKNLALAKDASKVHSAPEAKPAPKVDPKKGQGNNSAKPGRPEREADRKGRTFPKKSGTGRGRETQRDGAGLGEGRKRVEDGVSEAGAHPNGQSGEGAEPHVRQDGERGGERGGERRERRDRGERRERGERGERGERERPQLTEEELAAQKAQREAEERQMTLEEYQAKKATQVASEHVELKEARKVEIDPTLKNAKKQTAEVELEWGGKKQNKQQQQKKKESQPKKEVIALAPAARKKREESSPPPASGNNNNNKGRRSPNPAGSSNGNSNNAANAPAINLEDNSLFPSLKK